MRACWDCLGSGSHVHILAQDLREVEVWFAEDSDFPIADRDAPRSKLSWHPCLSCRGKGFIGEPLGPATVQVHNIGRSKNEPKGHKKYNKYYEDLGFRFPL